MATASEISTIITEIQAGADTILGVLQEVDPAVALPAAAAEEVANLLSVLANKAISAWSASAGIPITAASVAALYANPTPLTPPTS